MNSEMHIILPFLLAMIAAIVVLNMWATKLRIAYPILLVVAGLFIGFIPGLPQLHINPDLIFFIFLPPLLFEAAWGVSWKEMKKWWRIIGSFAFLVVFFTALSVAIVTNHFLPGFTLPLGFLLGGIVSPPDAVSTAAITRFVKIPKSFSAILEGESLLNDASSLIIFRFALLAVGTGQFIWQEAALSFVWMIIGGAAVGFILAWFFMWVHRKLPTEASSDIALTIIEPYFMYWLAEQLHCSGVLAVVCGGVLMSARRLWFLTSASRIMGSGVWQSFIYILNGIVFLIIGLELPEIHKGLQRDGVDLSEAIGYGVMVTGVLILARIISSYIAMIATLIFRPSVAPKSHEPKRRFFMPLLLGWTGMRGVVSLAAALAIPVTLDDGTAFPHRSLILFITFVVILLTLVVQGLTLPYFIKKSKFFASLNEDDFEASTRQKMKQGLKQQIYEFLKHKYETEFNGHEGVEKFLKQWEERAKSTEDAHMSEKKKKMFLEMLEIQRAYLAELNRDPKINESIIRQQLYQIDLEEERLKIV